MKWISNKIRELRIGIALLNEYFIRAMHAADKAAFSSDNGKNGESDGFEESVEKKSVYQDLLRGEVTEAVKELRHEMYYSERESYKYDVKGAKATKKENVIYNGKIENSDGNKVLLVQQVNELKGDLSDNILSDVIGNKNEREYNITVERDFIPRFKIEEYCDKIVIREKDENSVFADFYLIKYQKQFDKRHRIFLNELDKILNGYKRSEVLDFKSIEFVSNNVDTWGSENLMFYRFSNPSFITGIKDFEEYHILRFTMDIDSYGIDILEDIYNEETARKCENHEMRDGAAFYYENAFKKDTYDYSKAADIANGFSKE